MTCRSLVVSVLLVLPSGVWAQQVDLFALRDSLARMTDTTALYRMQSSLPMAGTARNVDALLARGLIGLRIYELTQDRDDSERARDVFRRGTERFPDVAWTHYGLALASVDAPDAQVPLVGGAVKQVTVAQSVAEIFGRDGRSRARRALRRALEVDPAFGPAATLLAHLATRDGRNREALQEARDALLAARNADSPSPDVVRALADVETALGNYAAAADAAERSLEEGGDAGALRAHAVALLLQDGREAEGAAEYFRGVDTLTPEVADEYYVELDALLTPAEAAEWRVSDVEARKLWLRRFWSRRAAESGATEAERLAEHYRRYAEARRRYLRNSMRGVDGAGVLLAKEQAGGNPFDERGVILIRHGEPDEVVRTQERGLLPNETWVYGRGEAGNLLFHFVALRGSRDFSLVRDLFEALDAAMAMPPDNLDPPIVKLVQDRAAYEPRYQAAVGRMRAALRGGQEMNRVQVGLLMQDVNADYRQRVREALEADTYFREFDRALPFHYDLFTFRTPSGRTDLTAAFAIPANRLTPEAAAGQATFPVRISVILMDTLQGVVTRADTVQRVSTRDVSDGFARAHVTLAVAPSEHTMHRVLVEDPAGRAGQLYGGPARLRDYSSMGLTVSDIVIAEPDSVGDWTRGDLQLALTLPRRFRPGKPFTVFYEVYNLRQQSRYRTQIVVEPVDRGGTLDRLRSLFGGGSDAIDLRFDDVAAPSAEGVIQEVRDLGSELRPGRYRLRVTVTDEASRDAATTETVFEVIA